MQFPYTATVSTMIVYCALLTNYFYEAETKFNSQRHGANCRAEESAGSENEGGKGICDI